LTLPVGTYTITLMQGGKAVSSRSNVTVRVGSGTSVNFASSSAENAQDLSAVNVTANALPSIDVTDVDSRTVITAEQLKTLPLGRSAEAIALLAPGTVTGSGFFSGPLGTSVVSFGGASVTENAYYINGMNVTDPLNGLGGISLPYGSIAQQEILTGGYSAAFGRSDGGVISQIGKSGTNEWHFGGQVLFRPKSLYATAKNTYYADGSLRRYRAGNDVWGTTVDGYVGGPLIKDRLFIFASAEGTRTHSNYAGYVGNATFYKATLKDPKWYAKINWNINDSNILELTGASTKHQTSTDLYDFDDATLTKGAYSQTQTGKTSAKMWIAKYTSYITDDLTLSAQFGKQQTAYHSDLPAGFDPNQIYIYGVTEQNPAITGGTPIPGQQKLDITTDPHHETKGMNYRLDLTYVLGNHTLKAGIDNQRTQDLNDGQSIPNNAGYNWEYGKVEDPTQPIQGSFPNYQVDAPANYPGGATGYYVDKYVFRSAASVRVEQRAQYIEDTWQVNDRLMVKMGLRNDQFTNYNNSGQAYIRQHKPQWAPRLGFSWDVNGDSSFKVYGNVGRYYLALPTSVALRGASGSLFTREYYTYTGIDPNTGYPTGLTPINTINGPGFAISSNNEYGQAPDPKTVTATNLKAQFQDEYILGFDKKLNDAWTYGAKLTRRVLRNEIDDTCNKELFAERATAAGLDTTNVRGCYFFNPGRKATFQLPNGNGGYGQFTVTNDQFGFPHAKRKYYGLEMYLEHPFDGKWWGKIDYLFSRSYGNTEGQVRSDIGQSDIAATVDWDYPSLMVYSNGRLANDHRHQIKIFGAYQVAPEWMVSGNILLMSGGPKNCLGAYGPDQTYPAYGGPYYHWCNGQPSPPGAAGSTPWQKIVNVGVTYRPEWADKKLSIGADVYNLFNSQVPTQTYSYNLSAYNTARFYTTPRYVRFSVSYDY
jgi:outer membrane receptor protein involved in Fe transport